MHVNAVLMVEFENATYVVKEGDGTLDVCLMKRGETALDFEVDISITETESAVGAEGVCVCVSFYNFVVVYSISKHSILMKSKL